MMFVICSKKIQPIRDNTTPSSANRNYPSRPHQWGPDLPFFGMAGTPHKSRWRLRAKSRTDLYKASLDLWCLPQTNTYWEAEITKVQQNQSLGAPKMHSYPTSTTDLWTCHTSLAWRNNHSTHIRTPTPTRITTQAKNTHLALHHIMAQETHNFQQPRYTTNIVCSRISTVHRSPNHHHNRHSIQHA